MANKSGMPPMINPMSRAKRPGGEGVVKPGDNAPRFGAGISKLPGGGGVGGGGRGGIPGLKTVPSVKAVPSVKTAMPKQPGFPKQPKFR